MIANLSVTNQINDRSLFLLLLLLLLLLLTLFICLFGQKEDWGACNLTSAVWQHNGDGFIGCYSTGEMAYWTVSNRGKPDYVNTFFGK